eukprot:TRINITY_DN2795_c0_g2_i1.p2 TRINITY_DN2795_c0_g2~~TRINITY_DN2795_c0_g2_i1.p2  ORF type:complete len:103 (+),score=13.19 TRINITY_DN2795_c0_g2_i1:202-510(+)
MISFDCSSSKFLPSHPFSISPPLSALPVSLSLSLFARCSFFPSPLPALFFPLSDVPLVLSSSAPYDLSNSGQILAILAKSSLMPLITFTKSCRGNVFCSNYN